MTVEASELHERDHDAFLDEVHSFEFWFQAVEGYLHDHPYGHRPETAEPEIEEAEREALVSTLCTYCVGEVAALEGASGMIGFAPNHQARIFLSTQVADEARHLEVFLHRLRELGIREPADYFADGAHRNLLEFKKRLLQFVDARDWEGAVFAQNVVLESMEFVTFHAHMDRADAKTAEILRGVITDERRHMGFGENDLGRRLAMTPHVRARLEQVKRELDALVLGTFEESLEALGVPRSDRPQLGRHYLETVQRLGFGQ